MMSRHDQDRRVQPSEENLLQFGIGLRKIEVLAPVLPVDDGRNRQRLANVSGEMAKRPTGDPLRLQRIGRDAALQDVLDGNPPALAEKRPEERGKTAPDVVEMILEKPLNS